MNPCAMAGYPAETLADDGSTHAFARAITWLHRARKLEGVDQTMVTIYNCRGKDALWEALTGAGVPEYYLPLVLEWEASGADHPLDLEMWTALVYSPGHP